MTTDVFPLNDREADLWYEEGVLAPSHYIAVERAIRQVIDLADFPIAEETVADLAIEFAVKSGFLRPTLKTRLRRRRDRAGVR